MALSSSNCVILVLLLLLPVVFSAASAAGTSSNSFVEEFSDATLDPAKWVVAENTNMSGYPAYGGAMQVSDGQLFLSSKGSSFPFIHSVSNPFPAQGDFTVEFAVTYTCVADSGCGIMLSDGFPTLDTTWHNRVFTLWGADEGPDKAVIYIELFNSLVYKMTVPGFKPSSPQHIYRVSFENGTYSIYVDDAKIATTKSQERPTMIVFGNPPNPEVPQSPQTVRDWGYWGWSQFKTDFIKVSAGLSENETPSALQGWQLENFGGHYSVLNSVARLWTDGGYPSPSVGFYRQVSPVADFSFSCELKATTTEASAIIVRSKLPVGGGEQGFNLEFGHDGMGTFILARHTSQNGWLGTPFASGDANTWYTIRLNVFKNPFRVVAEVFDDNGTLLGSISASDMNNIPFEDIKYIGFNVWGYSPSDYFFRNIKSTFDSPSHISISTESFSTQAGSAVNVVGTLCSSNSTPLQNKMVVLSYTFAGADSWIPISSSLTNEDGEYSIQWINTASGTFTLKAEWNGDGASMGASNSTTLSFLPMQLDLVLFVESNSTISSLAFNSTTSEIAFNATGPSGTTGYVIVTVVKTAVQNSNEFKVFLDGNQLNYTVTSTADAWLIEFNYSHSMHHVSMYLGNSVSQTTPFGVDNGVLLAVVATTVIGAAVVLLSIRKMGKNAHDYAKKEDTGQ